MRLTGFKKKVALLACSNLLLQLMGFVYRMALTRYAGTRALGLNSLIMQIYSIVVSVCISGLSVAGTNLAARVQGSPKALKALLNKCILLYCGLWLFAALPMFLLRKDIAGAALGENGAADTLAIMLVCIFMTGVENVLKAIHMGSGMVGRCAASEICEQGVRFALVILMLIKLPHEGDAQTVFYIMLGMTCSEIVSVGFLSFSFLQSIRALSKRYGSYESRITHAHSSDILRIALPASATAMASTLFASAASLLLPSRLALYGLSRGDALSLIGVMSSVATPITFLPMAVVTALSAVLMPEVARLEGGGVEEQNGAASRLAQKSLRFAAVFGFCASAVIAALAPYLSRGLFGVETESILFIALGIKAAVIYPQIVATAVLNGVKKQGSVLLFAVCGELYQLLMMLLLTPVWGLYGYIAAGITGEALRLLCSINAVVELYPKKHNEASASFTTIRAMR